MPIMPRMVRSAPLGRALHGGPGWGTVRPSKHDCRLSDAAGLLRWPAPPRELRTGLERGDVTAGEDALVSPRRIDYYDDPEVPKPSSLVPSVNLVVVNDAGEILMIRHIDSIRTVSLGVCGGGPISSEIEPS
jgi:hypothetical protein